MSTSSADFVRYVGSLGLLSPEQLAKASSWATKTPDAAPLSREMQKRGWLTGWQCEQAMRRGEVVVGSYQLLEPIGEGGMGQVFRARHTLMDRVVALKLVRPEFLGESSAVARFRREIQILAKMRHPNVVLALDAQLIDGRLLLAMEFCEGADLASLVRDDGPLPIGTACDYARQAALGLQHIHEHELVHRDVKPHNMLVVGGVVKILDLGLARLRNDAAPLTASNAVVGTADYLAPEQANDSRSVDIRADLYGLGGTLFFLLTGQPPFPGGSIYEKILRHQSTPPPDVRTLRARAPKAVCDIVAKLLAKDPADRYAEPRAAADALAPWTSDTSKSSRSAPAKSRTIDAPPMPKPVEAPRPIPPKPRPIVRRRRVWPWVAGAAGLLVVLAVTFWPGGGTPGKGTVPDAPPIVASLQSAKWEADGFAQTVADHSAFGVAFAPDGKSVAVTIGNYDQPDAPGAVGTIALADRTFAQLGTTRGSMHRLLFDRSGRLITATGSGSQNPDAPRGDIIAWDMNKRQPAARREDITEKRLNAMALSPAGDTLAVSDHGGRVQLLNAETFETIRELGRGGAGGTGLTFSPDGRLLAAGRLGGVLELLDPTGKAEPRRLKVDPNDVPFFTGLAFRPGTSRLVAATGSCQSNGGMILEWDTDTGKQERKYHHGNIHQHGMALAPDGRTLATGDADGRLTVTDLDTGNITELRPERGGSTIYGLSFSPDGLTLATAEGSGQVWFWKARRR